MKYTKSLNVQILKCTNLISLISQNFFYIFQKQFNLDLCSLVYLLWLKHESFKFVIYKSIKLSHGASPSSSSSSSQQAGDGHLGGGVWDGVWWGTNVTDNFKYNSYISF